MTEWKRNAFRCKKCGMVVESKSVHDFQACKCGNSTDGGLEYIRRGGRLEDMEDLSEPKAYFGEGKSNQEKGRKMKYRVWDVENESYNNPYSYAYYAMTQDGGVDFYCHGDHMGSCDPEKYIVEPSTGMVDDSGEEIFVGDIVKARWHRAKNARFNTEGEVKLDNGWFYIKDDPDGQDRLGVPLHNCYQLRVVGNIHKKEEN